MNRYHFVFLLFSGLLAFGATQYNLPDDGWKNLKVLPQNISDQALDSIMDNFKFALGVKCGFCHATNGDPLHPKLDFASDANPKKDVARYMMTMTDSINHKFFGYDENGNQVKTGVIMCYTCHRGSTEIASDDLMKLMPVEDHH